MIYFYAVPELYNRDSFDAAFIRAFDSLTSKAKKAVLENNVVFKMFLNNLSKSSYTNIDFSKNTIIVPNLVIRDAALAVNLCPLHAVALEQKTVMFEGNQSDNDVELLACQECQAFYLSSSRGEFSMLNKVKADYRIAELEIV